MNSSTKNFSKKALALIPAALLLTGLTACNKKEEVNDRGPAEQAGRQIDQATEKARANLSVAGDKAAVATDQARVDLKEAAREGDAKMEHATDTAGQKLNDAREKLGEKMEHAGEKMQADSQQKRAE
jgi:vacuolar-type H+-ATPase subunit H